MKIPYLDLRVPIETCLLPDSKKKFPGTGWVRHFMEMTMKQIPSYEEYETPIVSEEPQTDFGGNKRVAFCLESPIYADHFYSRLPEIKKHWKNVLSFYGGTEHAYFPSFDNEDIIEPQPFHKRQFLCAVVSNKHYLMLKDRPPASALETQLHDYRAKALGHFLMRPGFSLYGKGWGTLAEECPDKLEILSKHKFNLCFENGRYPGYITEKIIDCFVAGTVPVYLGAQDIADYIPPYLFIDASQFKTFQDMEDYLEWYPHFKRIKHAQEWLRCNEGQKFSNKYFAKRIFDLCQE